MGQHMYQHPASNKMLQGAPLPENHEAERNLKKERNPVSFHRDYSSTQRQNTLRVITQNEEVGRSRDLGRCKLHWV